MLNYDTWMRINEVRKEKIDCQEEFEYAMESTMTDKEVVDRIFEMLSRDEPVEGADFIADVAELVMSVRTKAE